MSKIYFKIVQGENKVYMEAHWVFKFFHNELSKVKEI